MLFVCVCDIISQLCMCLSIVQVAAVIELTWATAWAAIEDGTLTPEAITSGHQFALPKTIDFTVDYLRSGLPRDAYARATINRSGRRYASVHVEAWQDNRDRLFAQGYGTKTAQHWLEQLYLSPHR